MGLVSRLVETGAESLTRSIGVREISRPGDLCDVVSLGLTPPEAKRLQARVQKAVGAARARDHAALRPVRAHGGARCHAKHSRLRRVATLFGKVGGGLPGSPARTTVAARRGAGGPRVAARHLNRISCKRTCPRLCPAASQAACWPACRRSRPGRAARPCAAAPCRPTAPSPLRCPQRCAQGERRPLVGAGPQFGAVMGRGSVAPQSLGSPAQVMAAVGQASAGELEAGVGAQVVEVVGILVAASDGEHTGSQDGGDVVRHEQRIARIGNPLCRPVGDSQAAFGGGQQHDAAAGGDPVAIKIGRRLSCNL